MIQLQMSESDIIRAIKSLQYSPLAFLASRHFKEHVENIEEQKNCLLIWNSDNSDYIVYKYCHEDIDKISNFINEWESFQDEYLEDLTLKPISFGVEEKK